MLGNQMASLAVGVASCGSSQANINPYNELLFSSQRDGLNTQCYQNQETALLTSTGSSAANQAFDSQMDIQLPPLCGWENQSLFDDSGSYLLESLLEGIHEENLNRYP